MLVTLLSAAANAQPSTVAPSPPPSAPAAPTYSRRLVERPLLLPEGAFEVGIPLRFRNDQARFIEPSLLYASPAFELHLAFSYQQSDGPRDDTRWAAFVVGGRRELVPCRVPGLALGAQLVASAPTGDQPGVSPSAIVDYKRVLAPYLAIQPSLSLGYDYGQVADEMDVDHTFHQLDGAVELRAQLQAGSVFAIEALVRLAYLQDLGDNALAGVTSHGEQALGITALLSATPNTDLRFVYWRTLRSLDFASDGIVLALNIRRM